MSKSVFSNNKKSFIPIIITQNDFLNQVLVVDKIKQIKNYKNYFYVFESLETIIYNSMDDLELETINENTNKMLIRFKKQEIINFNDFIDYLSNKKKYIYLINSLNNMIKIIHLLNEKKIIHFQLNLKNIFVNDKKDVLLFNFNKAIELSQIKNKLLFIDYNPKNIFLPIEIQMISYLKSKQLESISFFHKEKMVIEFMENNPLLSFYNKLLFKKQLDEYLNKFINKSFQEILIEISIYYYTWDYYSLSILFIELLWEKKEVLFFAKIMNFLCKNIHPDPEFRSKNTIKEFNNLCDKMDYNNIF